MTDKICPPNALRVWASSSILYAECPSPDGREAHLLEFPLTPEGHSAFLSMLQARHEGSKIGTRGDLTKHQLRRELGEAVKTYRKPIQKSTPEAPSEVRNFIRGLLIKRGFING